MSGLPKRSPVHGPDDDERTKRLVHELLHAAFMGRTDDVIAALAEGAPVDARHEQTGLTVLHIAAGTNNAALVRLLHEEHDAPWGPDSFGRWPTTVAAECGADEALIHYIADAEAGYLETRGSFVP